MSSLDHILIFKTNISTPRDITFVKDVLDKHELIDEWNVDQADVDCVLRVISRHLKPADIIDLLSECNYDCAELTD